MTKKVTVSLVIIVGFVALLISLWQALPYWLPRVASLWLPVGSQLQIQGPLRWQQGALHLEGINWSTQQCRIASAQTLSLSSQHGGWVLNAEQLTIDTVCLAKLPPDTASQQPVRLEKIRRVLPSFSLNINQFSLTPWPFYLGKLQLRSSVTEQTLSYQGQNLVAEAILDADQQLTVNQLIITPPAGGPPIQLTGQITVPSDLNRLPEQGTLLAEIPLTALKHPLLLDIRWQREKGTLVLKEKTRIRPLATLPWVITSQQIRVEQGEWYWPSGQQSLGGGISFMLSEWQNGVDATQISARINMVTSGHQGKGNAVLTLGPGNLGLTASNLGFQLTGQVNLAETSLIASLPGTISGSLLAPTLLLEPGSLLRAKGKLINMRLEEARLPLAGVKVSAEGITGRLQAIISAKDHYWGQFTLHLDGQANNFWPDKGDWQWRYWGGGKLLPFSADWDITGKGRWQDPTITLDHLSTGFNQLKYGTVTVTEPRLTLKRPLFWQRNPNGSQFSSDIQLATDKISFNHGGYLPSTVLSLRVNGQGPESFQWQGAIQPKQFRPLIVRGRWDGERLRGEGWLPKQRITVFQTLLSPALNMILHDGEFYAQTAFSAAKKQGFEAGGHWVVKNAGMWLKDGKLDGLDFVLPYRLKNQQWQLGAAKPIMLRIQSLNTLFDMQNITADLQGTYPYSETSPLTLSNVGVDMLNGHISLAELRLPQRDAAVVKLDKLDLSVLFTALSPKQFAMSGRINGELPFYLNHPDWLVYQGWIANADRLTLRLDREMADAIGRNNLASRAAVDWLRYLEIGQLTAKANLDNFGLLTLETHIDGANPQKNSARKVILNYNHQENVFQLWRSLRFGDNLHEWLERALSQPGDHP